MRRYGNAMKLKWNLIVLVDALELILNIHLIFRNLLKLELQLSPTFGYLLDMLDGKKNICWRIPMISDGISMGCICAGFVEPHGQNSHRFFYFFCL